MESGATRRSPRRHVSTRSRMQVSAAALALGDQKTVAQLRADLIAAGHEAPARLTKIELCQKLAASEPGISAEASVASGAPVNGSSSSENMIPLSMSSAEHEKYQRGDSQPAGGASMKGADQDVPLVLWRRPGATVYHFLAEASYQLQQLARYLASRWQFVVLVSLLSVALAVASSVEGPHSQMVASVRASFLFSAWWIGLGILSSVGLGTGLHTFLLYLGPHIAAVTLASWSCMSVDFPSPPYPDEIQCPAGSPAEGAVMTIWMIISKVRWEAMMWGAGTAIGELPPYFVAKAARLAGQDMDPELEEAMSAADSTLSGRAKHFVHRMIKRVGFWGIFLAASIPNPLFDLAGITCGHFLVPFHTFFGATLLGKAVVKMHIQKVLVVFLFTKSHFEALIRLIGRIPSLGPYLQKPFVEYLEKQKQKYHRKMGAGSTEETSMLSYAYGLLVIGMVSYFLLSIFHSMAQQHAKRTADDKRE